MQPSVGGMHDCTDHLFLVHVLAWEVLSADQQGILKKLQHASGCCCFRWVPTATYCVYAVRGGPL
jgi:hypothetical protein